MTSLKNRLIHYYEKHETRVDLAFFLGGFVFDIFTLSDLDDPFSILQQVVYLSLIGFLVLAEILAGHGKFSPPPRLQKVWEFRQLILHFLLGSLLSVYSLFFLKSSSIFSSAIFLIFLIGLLVGNELKPVQKSEVNLKVALFVSCLFCFFATLVPVILGFVGWVPFLLALGLSGLVCAGALRLLQKKEIDKPILQRSFLLPSAAVLALFFVFYLLRWIPPVPLSVKDMGVYHKIEKAQGRYQVSHENPWWRFWHRGDQDFRAAPGDLIYFFARLFSPARFDDTVVLHWLYKDPREGWKSTDRIPMRVMGGKTEHGFRGFAVKQNYTDGDWQVRVETTDEREIGRLYFEVTKLAEVPAREFVIEQF